MPTPPRSRPRTVLAQSIASMLVLSSSAFAATWTGTVSGDFNNTANWDVNPSGQNVFVGILGNDGGPAPFRATLSADLAFPIVDLQIARTGGPSIFNHTAGSAATGNNNWVDVGTEGGNGTYNLANTAGTGGTLTGFAQGSGSVSTGGPEGRIYVGGVEFGGGGGTGLMNIHTTGSVNAFRLIVGEQGTGVVKMDSGTINLTNDMTVGYRTNGANIGNGTFQMSGGTLNRTGGWTTFGRDGTSQGHFNMSGGTVNAVGQTIVGLNQSTGNTFTISGGIYNAGELHVGRDNGASGAVTVSAGTLNVNTWLVASLGNGQGSLTVSGTGEVNQGLTDAGSRLELTNPGGTGTATVNLNGGSITTNGVVHSSGAGGTSNFNFNGGTLRARIDNGTFMQGLTAATVQSGGARIDTNGFAIAIAQPLNGAGGGLTKQGAGVLTLAGASNFTGITDIDGGSLLVTGALSSTSAVNVDAGATLGGTGTINSAATLSIASGGILSPGVGPGILSTGSVSLSSGSDFVLELNGSTLGTGYDNLNVTGTFSLGGSDLLITLGSGFAPTIGDTFTVASNDLAESILGSFGTINGGSFGAGDTFTLSNDQGTFDFMLHYDGEGSATSGGNDLVIQTVPEPGVAGLLAFSALAFAGRRRRK